MLLLKDSLELSRVGVLLIHVEAEGDGIADAARARCPAVAFGPARPNSEARNGVDHGVLKLTLHPRGYDWQFVPVAPDTMDEQGYLRPDLSGGDVTHTNIEFGSMMVRQIAGLLQS